MCMTGGSLYYTHKNSLATRRVNMRLPKKQNVVFAYYVVAGVKYVQKVALSEKVQ